MDLTWNSHSIIKKGDIVLGIIELNEYSNNDFIEYIKYLIVTYIKKEKNKYNRYDIENGILSRMQNNKLMNKDKYNLINKIREYMWSKFNDDFDDNSINLFFEKIDI